MEEFTKNIKNLFREKINVVITLLIAILCVEAGRFYYEIKVNKAILKKIDHRYFNITKSLEDINGVELNTKNGELKRLRY